ncbi:MAG: sugar ABC transporter permease, partial [Pseudomonadota bacterium]
MMRTSTPWWFVGPAVFLMLLILIVPILLAAGLSFTDYGLGNSTFNYVGWQNYDRLFSRSTYEKMFLATFTYVVVVVPLSVGLGLGAALLIYSLGRFGD